MGSDDKIGNVSTFLWWIGWRFEVGVALGTVLAFLVGAMTTSPVGFLVGAATGLGLWYLGTKEIDRTYWTLLETYAEYTNQVREHARNRRQYEAEYTLNFSSGPTLFVTPDERYFTTSVFVGDESVTFHEGVGVDMKQRTPYMKDETREIRYDRIASIRYVNHYLWIKLIDEKSLRYYANDRPDELLADVRERMDRRSQATSEKADVRVRREFN